MDGYYVKQFVCASQHDYKDPNPKVLTGHFAFLSSTENWKSLFVKKMLVDWHLEISKSRKCSSLASSYIPIFKSTIIEA